MAPFTNIPLSPAELSYLHKSLSHDPPIRPDGRSPTQFRPLVAETDILPTANGSARICFADGTEAVVGVKAEVESSGTFVTATGELGGVGVLGLGTGGAGDVHMDEEDDEEAPPTGKGEESWLEVAMEIPGMRDDDALPIFLSAMVTEALLADGELKDRLWINRRFHWRLYIDVCVGTNTVGLFIANGKSVCRFCCYRSLCRIHYHCSH
jgi:exosome complex component RRP42